MVWVNVSIGIKFRKVTLILAFYLFQLNEHAFNSINKYCQFDNLLIIVTYNSELFDADKLNAFVQCSSNMT